MNYLLIEEKAWAEITAHAQHMAEKVRQLEQHFNPAAGTEWIGNKTVCQWLGISMRTLQYFRESGVIPYTIIGNKCYYKAEDIKAVLDEKMNLWKTKQK